MKQDAFMKKIIIIGVGVVGSTIAYTLSIRQQAKEIVLIDQIQPLAEGEVLDIQNGLPLTDGTVVRRGTFTDCKNADLIIIAAGRSRHEGEKRLDLLESNLDILKNILPKLKENYTGGYILVVSNPVDALTYYVSRQFPDFLDRVIGTGTALDSIRLQYCVGNFLGITDRRIKGYVIGEHGQIQMPLWGMTTIDSIPISEYCKRKGITWNKEIQKLISDNVKEMGTKIILGKSRTHFGIASCISYLVEIFSQEEEAIVCVSQVRRWKERKIAYSQPTLISHNGLNELPLQLSEEEKETWEKLCIQLYEIWDQTICYQ